MYQKVRTFICAFFLISCLFLIYYNSVLRAQIEGLRNDKAELKATNAMQNILIEKNRNELDAYKKERPRLIKEIHDKYAPVINNIREKATKDKVTCEDEIKAINKLVEAFGKGKQ